MVRAIMATIASNLQAVCAAIVAAARTAGRQPEDIRLLAVGKTFAAEAVREAWQVGQECFAESYVREALDKMAALRDLPMEPNARHTLQLYAEQLN